MPRLVRFVVILDHGLLAKKKQTDFGTGASLVNAANAKKIKVVSHESMMRLIRDLEGWANARIVEYKEAKQQNRFMPYHNENHFCARGQLDAADRIRDILREESFVANAKGLARRALDSE